MTSADEQEAEQEPGRGGAFMTMASPGRAQA